MPVYDQASLVEESLASVRDAILIGIVLSLLVIAVALRDWRAGLIAALPVPITLLGTFAIMRWLGVTLNLMSLGGLAIAIGLVVDDAIVVSEGIVRRLEDGHPVAEAVELGTRDMFAPVIGTTLTTVVVFAPLVLLTGVTGSFLGALAVTLAIAVLLSMLMALTLIPLLAHRLHARAKREEQGSTDRTGRAIAWLLRHRLIALALVGALLGGGLLAERLTSTGFLPHMDEGAFVIDFVLPAGTSLEESARIMRAADDVLRARKDVVAFTRRNGTEMGPATATLQNTGDIMVRLAPPGERAPIDDVIADVRDQLRERIPEVRFEYVQVLQDVLADLAGNPSPIEVRLLGNDPQQLERYAETAGERLAKLPELEDFFDGREGAAPILRARPQLDQVTRLGLDAASVGDDLEIAVAGREIAEVLRPERVIGVRVRYPDAIRLDAAALARSPIAYGPRSLPLGDVVTFDRPLASTVRLRDGLRSAAVMTAAAADGDLGAAESAVASALRRVPPPAGVEVEIGGQAASARSARHELYVVAITSILLVLLVLSVQLRSLRYALVVLAGAPLSTVGGLAILAITGLPLDISSMTGLILLVGLVVKNGILLLEHAQRGLASGLSIEQALQAASRRRLRPILMTTAATIAGLAPLALGIGAGAELQRPLAVTVIGGLAFASAVTLVITPGLTALVTRRARP